MLPDLGRGCLLYDLLLKKIEDNYKNNLCSMGRHKDLNYCCESWSVPAFLMKPVMISKMTQRGQLTYYIKDKQEPKHLISLL